jgi:hypothetical protein
MVIDPSVFTREGVCLVILVLGEGVCLVILFLGEGVCLVILFGYSLWLFSSARLFCRYSTRPSTPHCCMSPIIDSVHNVPYNADHAQ